MQNGIQSLSPGFLKVFSDKEKFCCFFSPLYLRTPGSLIIFLVNRKNGRMNFTLGWVKEQQLKALVLKRGMLQ